MDKSNQGEHVSEDSCGGEVFALEVSEVASTPKQGLEVRIVSNSEEKSGDLEREQSETPLCRKVLPMLEEEENVCSICLDEFTGPDPSVPTSCGHGYHLQCIMQWAQRSHECPLCFHKLKLEDDTLNELLPFGEYVSPREQAANASMLESWEFERFLVRLAAAEANRDRRSSRNMMLLRGSGRVEPSSPQPISGRSASERIGGGHAFASMPSDEDPSAGGGPVASSWPPSQGGNGADEGGPSANGDHPSIGEMLSPTLRSASQAIRSKFASLRLTKDLKSLFGSTSRGN